MKAKTAANAQPKKNTAPPKKLPLRRDQEDDDEDEEEDDDEEEETKPMTKLQQLDLKISGKKPSIKTGATKSSVSASEVSAYDKVCLFRAICDCGFLILCGVVSSSRGRSHHCSDGKETWLEEQEVFIVFKGRS